jgi:hypothetical protein
MPHTGVEAKPTWQAVPLSIRRQTEATLGDRVVRASRVWGGYSPTPTFRLALAGGKRAFFKGVFGGTNRVATNAFKSELRSYEALSPLVGKWMPEFLGSFQLDDWLVMLLEDLGPRSVPPWTPALTRQVSAQLGDFHLETTRLAFPAWIEPLRERTPEFNWPRLAEDSRGFETIAATAGEKSREAVAWLDKNYALFAGLSANIEDRPATPVLLHGDIRSDNLRLVGGRLKLFDWPYVNRGAAEYDLVEFAQSVTVEAGPLPEKTVEWYCERYPVDPDLLTAYISWFCAFFATLYWRAELPGLPRLRKFQRDQLRVLLYWLCRRVEIPGPDWL